MADLILRPDMQSGNSNYPDLNAQFKQQADDAELGLTYGAKVNQGINAFSEAVETRLKTPVDEKGNPTFSNFSEDANNIAKETIQELVKDVDSPVAKFAITQGYAQYIKSQAPGLENKNRENQLNYYNESFYNNIKQLKDKLLNDENIDVNYYKGEMDKNIGMALNSGVIDNQTAMQIMDRADKDLIIATANQVGSKNPDLLIQSLSNPDFLPSLSIDDRIALQQRAEGIKKDRDLATLQTRVNREAEDVSAATITKATADAELADGVLTKERLASIKKSLLSSDYEALDKELDRTINNKMMSLIDNNQITQEIQSGNLGTSWSKKQLKDSYMSTLSGFEQRMKRSASLPEKAMLATQYNGKVTQVVDDMARMVKEENDPAKLADVVKTFTYLETKQPTLLSHMSKEDKSMLIAARSNMLDKNLDPAESFNRARQVKILDKETKQMLSGNFRTHMKDFDVDNFLNEKVFDDEYTSNREMYSLGLLSQSNFVDPSTSNRVKKLLEDEYLRTGDFELAKKTVEHDIKSTYGVSQVGASPNIMYAPPEKMFPGYKAEELRADLLNDVHSVVGDSIPSSEVDIMPVPGTRGLINTATGQPVVQYAVTRKVHSPDGDYMVPVTNPNTHSPLMWTPSLDKISDMRKLKQQAKEAQALIKAQEKRQKILDLETKFRNE